jgi:hypothetical protein
LISPKYLDLKEGLSEKLSKAAEKHSLYPMYHTMLERTERYLDEALCCHTLIIATIMHPYYRMDLFEIAFGAGSIEVTRFLKLLGNDFQNVKKSQVKEKDVDPKVTVIEKSTTSARTSIMDRLAASRQEE